MVRLTSFPFSRIRVLGCLMSENSCFLYFVQFLVVYLQNSISELEILPHDWNQKSLFLPSIQLSVSFIYKYLYLQVLRYFLQVFTVSNIYVLKLGNIKFKIAIRCKNTQASKSNFELGIFFSSGCDIKLQIQQQSLFRIPSG